MFSWGFGRSQDRASLAALMPYDSYDPEGQVFVGRDGSLGLAWTLETVECETRSAEELKFLSGRFAELFKHLPAGSAFQVILRSDRDVRLELAPWLRDDESSESNSGTRAAHDLVTSHARILSKLAVDDEGKPFLARRLRLYITVRIFPDLGGASPAVSENYAREKTGLLEVASTIESFLTQMSIPHRRLSAEDLKGLLYRILNPVRSQEIAPRPFREEEPLRHQIVRSESAHLPGKGVLTLDGFHHRVVSMIEPPLERDPGMVSLAREMSASILDLIPDSMIVYNVEVLDDHLSKRCLERKYSFAWNQLRTRKKLNIVAIEEDANAALAELMAGARLLKARLHAVVWADTVQGVRAKSSLAKRVLQDLGLEMVEEDALTHTLFMHLLPLGYDPAFDRGLKRSSSIISTHLADLLPVYGAYRGTKTPEVLLQNRRGEPVSFSLFDSNVAPHGIVAGVSGSGKSFFTNYLVTSAIRAGGRVFILDRGDSYRKLCEALGGLYVVFDPRNPRSINPCGKDLDEEKKIFLADIFSEMASQGQRELSVKEQSLVSRAVSRAFAGASGREVLSRDIVFQLETSGDAAGHDLAVCLDKFANDGPYAGFFDRPSTIERDAPITVFELGEVAKRKDVASVLLMALIHRITEYCRSHLDLRKYLIVDEAWTLLKSGTTARFLEDVLRTYRKLNSAAVMVTQQVTDFAGTIGEAIRANAPNRVFLMQTPETVLAMEKLLDLTPERKKAIANLRTVKGKYSELFISLGEESAGVARLIPDSYLYYLATSDPADNAKLYALAEERRKEGDPSALLSAVRILSEAA
jgi:conjugal transfer ATP-binding protein TraC